MDSNVLGAYRLENGETAEVVEQEASHHCNTWCVPDERVHAWLCYSGGSLISLEEVEELMRKHLPLMSAEFLSARETTEAPLPAGHSKAWVIMLKLKNIKRLWE